MKHLCQSKARKQFEVGAKANKLLDKTVILISILQAMNLVDFLAILPYFISLGLESLEDLHILGKAGKIMRLVRVMRILRIFKLVRHFAGLQSLLYTLKQVKPVLNIT